MNKFHLLLCFIFIGFINYAQPLKQIKTEKYSVYFDFDKSVLTVDENQKLHNYIDNLGNIVLLSMALEGFCDDRGSVDYNRTLSEKRAKTVEKILIEMASKQKNVEGKGKIELRIVDVDAFELESKRLLNRRVDIYLEYFVNDYINLDKPKDSLPTDVEINERVVKMKNFEDEPLKAGDIIRLDQLFFEGGRAVLLKKSKKQLSKMLKQIQDHPTMKFEIQGHVCCIDTDYFRDAVDEDTGINNLSESRAKAIFEYLIANGIAKERMTYKGYGRDFPLKGKEKNNKRVEILLLDI